MAKRNSSYAKVRNIMFIALFVALLVLGSVNARQPVADPTDALRDASADTATLCEATDSGERLDRAVCAR